jgi:hypothetical protein
MSNWDFDDIQPLYDVITVLRTFCLKEEDLEVYKRMQDHQEEWTQRSDFVERFRSVGGEQINTGKKKVVSLLNL